MTRDQGFACLAGPRRRSHLLGEGFRGFCWNSSIGGCSCGGGLYGGRGGGGGGGGGSCAAAAMRSGVQPGGFENSGGSPLNSIDVL